MRPGPRRSLSHAEILDAAFDLLETKGFAAVSVRGVAGSLGITPTALYTYYPSKRALLRGMIEHLLARLDLGTAGVTEQAGDTEQADVSEQAEVTDRADVIAPIMVDPARARLVRLSLSLRELLTGHAGALELIMSGPLDGPNAMRLNEAILESFTAAGLELDDAARAAYALQAFALGSIALESAEVDVEADAATSEPLIMTDASGAALWTDLARFPLSEQTAVVAAERTSTAQFVWGVEGLLAGLLARG